MEKLHFIAAYLTKYEVMDGEQFAYAMENASVTDEDLQAILDKRKKQSTEENRQAAEDDDSTNGGDDSVSPSGKTDNPSGSSDWGYVSH